MLLTFDDGPSEWTFPILDLLAEHHALATFFVVGQQIEGREHIIASIHDLGHTVGVHSWSHARLTAIPLSGARVELAKTADAIARVTGERPQVWRAPYFATDEAVDGVAAELGLVHQGADVIPDDWRLDDPEVIARIVLDEARGGEIVCLHDGIPPDGGSEHCTASRQTTVDAVRMILESFAR